MAEYHVSTIDDLFTLLKDFTDLDKTIFIDNDIDFNDTDYWNKDANFCTIPYTDKSVLYTITINGQNHSLTNIYLYPGRSFIAINAPTGSSSTASVGLVKLNLKNIKFEVMSNSSYFIRYIPRLDFDNCQFNMKLYGITGNTMFYCRGANIPASVVATNTLFNIYINSTGSGFSYTGSTNYGQVMKIEYEYNGSTSLRIESSVIKIQNRTPYALGCYAKYGMFYCDGYYSQNTIINNSAIFYNDVGNTKPNYSTDMSLYKYICITNQGYTGNSPNKCMTKTINSYFASFGTPSNKPIIAVSFYNSSANPRTEISSCFFDNDKLACYYHTGSGMTKIDKSYGCAQLTTAQCKDPDALSEAGFIFAEETN